MQNEGDRKSSLKEISNLSDSDGCDGKNKGYYIKGP